MKADLAGKKGTKERESPFTPLLVPVGQVGQSRAPRQGPGGRNKGQSVSIILPPTENTVSKNQLFTGLREISAAPRSLASSIILIDFGHVRVPPSNQARKT